MKQRSREPQRKCCIDRESLNASCERADARASKRPPDTLYSFFGILEQKQNGVSFAWLSRHQRYLDKTHWKQFFIVYTGKAWQPHIRIRFHAWYSCRYGVRNFVSGPTTEGKDFFLPSERKAGRQPRGNVGLSTWRRHHHLSCQLVYLIPTEKGKGLWVVVEKKVSWEADV